MVKRQQWKQIPVFLSPEQFKQFVLPHLCKGRRGPASKLSFYKIFNYILRLLHTGCQWEELPIAIDEDGRPEIHHIRIYRMFRFWD